MKSSKIFLKIKNLEELKQFLSSLFYIHIHTRHTFTILLPIILFLSPYFLPLNPCFFPLIISGRFVCLFVTHCIYLGLPTWAWLRKKDNFPVTSPMRNVTSPSPTTIKGRWLLGKCGSSWDSHHPWQNIGGPQLLEVIPAL